MVIAATAWAAVALAVPDWARWTLAGIALAVISSLGIAWLIGPAARRLAGEHRPLTAAERRQMTATERVEAVNAARHTLIQAATGLVIIAGVVFTAQGLWYTAQSLDASRQAQRTAEQGQITDRYTKAVEQLGSRTLDIRLGGIYALERLAQDSPRDHQTIYDVLAAFTREHDPKPKATMPDTPTTDIQAALTVIGRRDTTLEARRYGPLKLIRSRGSATKVFGFGRGGGPDLSNLRIRGADLLDANLIGANLIDANLTDAYLFGANLTDANLLRANMSDAELQRANLGSADLSAANLHAANLDSASLIQASLSGADLSRADLTSANLYDANLYGANLYGASLAGADLRGADLGQVTGLTPAHIRRVARTDHTTRF
ncbi:pentapeptide repeat-containing protein [Sphaerisporangium aureirubrum]|uniref:Pentapeptide repeat-containing protein n=1 Tax=Sphaerisporangium aureirubrum TaxID=1544736 RepID=A0ABW1ND06_9ACTN